LGAVELGLCLCQHSSSFGLRLQEQMRIKKERDQAAKMERDRWEMSKEREIEVSMRLTTAGVHSY